MSNKASCSKISVGNREKIRLNILLLGEKGIGKRSFIHSLMKKYVCKEDMCTSAINHSFGAASNSSGGADDDDDEVIMLCSVFAMQDLQLSFFSFPGFGVKLSSPLCIARIYDELEQRHMQWADLSQLLTDEERLLADERIHSVMYFLSPNCIKAFDVRAIESLSIVANVTPIIGKADSLTPREKQAYLTKVYEMFCSMGASSPAFRFEEDPLHLALLGEEKEEQLLEPLAASAFCDEGFQRAGCPEDSGISLIRSFDHFDGGDCDGAFAESLHRIGRQQFCTTEQQHLSSPAITVTSEDGSPFRVPDAFAIISDPSGSRVYSYGVVAIENPYVSDFIRLQRLLFEDGRTIARMRLATQQKTVMLVSGRQQQKRSIIRSLLFVFVVMALLLVGSMYSLTPFQLKRLLRGGKAGPAVVTSMHSAAPPEGAYSSTFEPLTGQDLVKFLFGED